MKFPTLLALLLAVALCTGCEKVVPANIKAPSESDQAASDQPAATSADTKRDVNPADWHRADSGRYGRESSEDDRYTNHGRYSDDDRYADETPSVTDALSDEADEIAQRLKQRAVKGIDSLSDRFENTINRGLKKLDDASREAYDESDEQ